MTRVLPPLHDGHAPILLHHAFEDALDAYEVWGVGMEEPAVHLDGSQVPISAVFGRMRTCTDILPVRLLDAVKDVARERADSLSEDQPTYAEAAFVLRALAVERLRAAA